MTSRVDTPEPPYYVVIFTFEKAVYDDEYGPMSDLLYEQVAKMDGYLGHQDSTTEDGVGVSVSYWRDEPSIAQWKRHTEHARAQARGKAEWYAAYDVRVAKVERAIAFTRR